jgi:hypothetical protein
MALSADQKAQRDAEKKLLADAAAAEAAEAARIFEEAKAKADAEVADAGGGVAAPLPTCYGPPGMQIVLHNGTGYPGITTIRFGPSGDYTPQDTPEYQALVNHGDMTGIPTWEKPSP